MKFELEEVDTNAIAQRVAAILVPHLANNTAKHQDDTIFDVQGLADYLKMSKKWVYEQSHLKTIPFIKLGNKQVRFRKTDIDHWLKSLSTPTAEEPTSKAKLLCRPLPD